MDRQERVLEIRTRLHERRAIALEGEKLGPPCSKCLHGPITNDKRCTHLAFWEWRYDPVTGNRIGKHLGTTVSQARGNEGLCGPEALLFERRSLFRQGARLLNRYGPWPIWYGGVAIVAGAAIILGN